MIEKPAE